MDLEKLSGLELVQAIIDGKVPPANISQIIPMKFSYAENGIIRGTAIANQQHQNPSGSVHGGFSATVIDTFTAIAIMTTLGPGDRHTTIDLNVKMLRKVPVDQTLTVEGKVINIGRRLGVSDATIKNGDGKVLNYGSASCMIFRADKSLMNK